MGPDELEKSTRLIRA